MATLVLSAVGAAVGSGFGGSVLGLSGMIIGRAVGATVGRVIDQRLMGGGSQAVETGRMDRLRLSGASEGAPVPLVWGRVRLGGQVIWASDFLETVTTSGGGGGKIAKKPKVTEYSYSISLAIALCEGPILGIGRIWADGQELVAGDLNIRLYRGDEGQLPDPLIAAIQGNAPAYRGIAYVVIEDLPLGEFGNRVPQFSFEVMRAVASNQSDTLSQMIRGVALMPGSGDVALATTPVYSLDGTGERALNLNSATGQTDIAAALDALGRELPNVRSGLMIVSWFGSDLRAGNCVIEPKVEEAARWTPALPWSVAGRAAGATPEVLKRNGRPVYGGTPSDGSVVQAIATMKARGLDVVYYPFILMEQTAAQALPDPWSNGVQPDLPWRGRITSSKAAGQPGSPDGTAQAAAEVAAFFGTAQASHFTISAGQVGYSGPNEWRYRRFILHQAALCAAAGGVSAFCIGSEMRGLTTIRGAANSFPAVAALRALAADVRAILGPGTKITYAADWSEYFGLITPQGDRFFHLDPLWADHNINAIAIDNYMPLSDWRNGDTHLDAQAGDVYALDYLTANVAGGEGFDWFYASNQDRAQQIRTPITDDPAWNEPWIWRYKDLRGWWENDHHDRVGGMRAAQRSSWVPRSKPIWFTEYGCPAIDRGTNQPNVFLDPKSSESAAPYFSRGGRDDTIQMQYFRAVNRFWSDPAHNPVSEIYGGQMVDMTRAHAWAWDARPYPWFPGNLDLWADGANWTRGHWLTGRATGQPLDALIREICARAGVLGVDVTRVWGVVRGFAVPSTDSPRAQLQSLMLAYGVEVAERDGRLIFAMRAGRADAVLTRANLVRDDDGDLTLIRAPQAEVTGRIRLSYVSDGGAFDLRVAEVVFPDESAARASGSDLPLVLTGGEARAIAERWLSESRVARDTARFALPPSSPLGAGDVVAFGDDQTGAGLWRIDRTTLSAAREVEATRIDAAVYGGGEVVQDNRPPMTYTPPAPVQPLFLDLPLFASDADPQAPWLALRADPWPGAVAVHQITQTGDFVLDALVSRRATMGVTQTPLLAAPTGRWDHGPAVRVQMTGGALSSVTRAAVLGGANLLAIGTGGAWEILQFAEAALVGPDLYDLRTRLRGQFGTDADMQAEWPAGAQVVLLDGGVSRLDLPLDAVGLARRYRIGPASRPLDDPAQRDFEVTFGGIGLRPYRPVHLRAVAQGGDLAVTWVRRTRAGGDGWTGVEVPLSEEREAYVLRVTKDGDVLREVALTAPFWTYDAGAQLADGAGGSYTLSVAQVSATYGAGPFASLQVGA